MTKPSTVKVATTRLSEGIAILKKLLEVGITETEPGYKETKRLVTDWFRATGTEADKSAEHTILFPRHGRKGILMLPVREGRLATYVLKVDT